MAGKLAYFIIIEDAPTGIFGHFFSRTKSLSNPGRKLFPLMRAAPSPSEGVVGKLESYRWTIGAR